MDDVASVLSRIETDAGLPRTELMRRAGLSYATWIAWKGGKRRPSAESLRAIERVLRETGERQVLLADALSLVLRRLRQWSEE